MNRLIGQLSSLVNNLANRPVNVRAWRMWVMAVLTLILGDHLGMWELHDLFVDGIDIHEVGVIIAGIGALLSSVTGKE
jgi:hypothetical protein